MTAPQGPTVLVVDDALVDRHLAGGVIETALGWPVVYAEDGAAALAEVQREAPGVVLTDVQMPHLNGLELVVELRRHFPLLPVVLMTGYGSEELALEALRRGAASYVPKKRLAADLPEILQAVHEAATVQGRDQRLDDCLTRVDSYYRLDNDPALLRALVAVFEKYVIRLRFGAENGRIRLGVALQEALSNALFHGNLELDSALREDDTDRYWKLADERRRQPPYRDRRIHVTLHLSREEIRVVIRDDGRGFDPSQCPDPDDPVNLERRSGRGLLLIRTFMDEVTFNPTGNQITLVKRYCPAANGR